MVGRLTVWADGSTSIGAGHLVRSRVLAEALALQGWQAQWFTPDPQGPAAWAWAGLPLQAAAGPPALGDLLLIDGYTATTPPGLPCVRIHDGPAGPTPPADFIVEGMPGARAADHPQAIACAGLAHALLRPAFGPGPESRVKQQILVALGGTDAAALLPRVCDVLLAAAPQAQLLLAGVAQAPSAHPRLQALGLLDAQALASQLRRVAAAVVSASGIALEALACACPVLAIGLAANQDRLARALSDAGVPLCRAEDLQGLAAALPAACCPQELRADGLGQQRVAARIGEWWQCRSGGLLRPARYGDAQQLYDWLSDPGVQAASLQGGAVPSWEAHCAWFAARLDDPRARIFIAEGPGPDGPQALGVLRLQCDADGAQAVVSLSTDPRSRGQGLGPRLLREGLRILAHSGPRPFAQTLRALVRVDNPASLRCFVKAGFRRSADEVINGHPTAVFLQQVVAP
ncbi:MAG: GNAT family N-acetyltransferase [Planctomycetota bacterium]|nr:MAG: GNAT family N-acetyltransferase [Planctomycetota bacterium]